MTDRVFREFCARVLGWKFYDAAGVKHWRDSERTWMCGYSEWNPDLSRDQLSMVESWIVEHELGPDYSDAMERELFEIGYATSGISVCRWHHATAPLAVRVEVIKALRPKIEEALK